MPELGCRMIYQTLDRNWPYGRDKTEKLSFTLGFRVRSKRNLIKTAKAGSKQLPNLIKGREINGINQVWQSDMTYYFLAPGVVVYLIFITDVYSQRIIGHGAFGQYPKEVFVKVLRKAFYTRTNHDLKGTIHHSDRGSQYGSDLYAQVLKSKDIIQSMRKYSWENPYAEKVNDIVKNKYLAHWKPHNMKTLQQMINKAVYSYNHKQKKNSLEGMAPVSYEQWTMDLPESKRPNKP